MPNARRQNAFWSPTLALVALAAAAGCSSENAKEATTAVVGTAVEVSKGAATGIAKGIVEGRKKGESADGAFLVTKWDDLKDQGVISVFESTKVGDVITVTLAVENKSDKPMRVANMQTLGIDGAGFVVKSNPVKSASLTVPPKSKVRHSVTFNAKKDGLSGVRVLGHDLKVKPVAAKAPAKK